MVILASTVLIRNPFLFLLCLITSILLYIEQKSFKNFKFIFKCISISSRDREFTWLCYNRKLEGELKMELKIRKARKEDAQATVPLIMEAIGDISMQMTGETEETAITKEFVHLFSRTDNRHSYLHTYVAEMEGKVAGALVFYTSEQAVTLDANLEKYLSNKKGTSIKIDRETLPGEWYIDTVVVDPTYRGHGIGTKLLTHAEQLVKNASGGKLSLNVETEKEAAIRLYNRLGFVTVCPWTIIGEPFHHMVKTVDVD